MKIAFEFERDVEKVMGIIELDDVGRSRFEVIDCIRKVILNPLNTKIPGITYSSKTSDVMPKLGSTVHYMYRWSTKEHFSEETYSVEEFEFWVEEDELWN